MSDAPDDPSAASAAGAGAAWPPVGPPSSRPVDPGAAARSAALGGLTGPDGAPALAARRPWSAWSEIRGDLRPAGLLVAALAVAGFPIGLLWWALAPRADFRITADGPVAIGNPPAELLAADDAVFALLLAAVGLLAGVLAWAFLRRRRGVAVLLALAVGASAAAGIAWQLGELLGPAPTQAELSDVGARVTTSLTLGSLPALAAGPFCAVLAYLVATLFTRRDDLGRPVGQPAAERPVAGEPALAWSPVDPAPGRPRD
ncbi:hypothetical protein [Geodermatophilus sp. URMC 64]